MAGFFKGSSKMVKVPIRVTGCHSCGLSSGCMHPKMEPSGYGRKKILIVAEAPGEDEDRLGTQLIGKVGQYFRKTLNSLGIDLDRDCRKTNSVRCRPPGNREPSPQEKAMCRKHLFDEIKKSKPLVIIPLGNSALWSLLESRWKRDSNFSITRWRGLTIPDHDLCAWLCPTFHPSYVQRNLDYVPATETIWKRDLERALSMVNKPLPKKPDPDIRILKGEQIEKFLLDLWRKGKARNIVMNDFPFAGLNPGTEEWMQYWRSHPEQQHKMLKYQKNPVPLISRNNSITIAFDFETTGLKPYRDGHRIVCCSVAESPDLVSSWMWDDSKKTLFGEMIRLPTIKKIAGNMKFEHVWTRKMCGIEVQGWHWDTVIAAKALDYRPGNSNVKFQAYTRLGVLGYDDSMEPYIGSPGNDPNGFNRMLEAPEKEILEYCAMDSALEYGIALRQMEEMEEIN